MVGRAIVTHHEGAVTTAVPSHPVYTAPHADLDELALARFHDALTWGHSFNAADQSEGGKQTGPQH